MALTQVSTGGIKDGQVHTADIASANITFDKFEVTALDHRYTLGVSGSDHFTFQGEGLTGSVNDPTLYLTRGKTYRFALSYGSGSHPFRIQSTTGTSGTEYNTGVTNNGGAGGSTVIFEVPHDAPDVLYYQCTSHAAMNGIFYVTGALADGTVTTAKLADQAVTLAKLPHGDNSSNGKFLRANNGADPSFETVSIPAGTTINNNADNKVITGSGTANTLEAETNLTWDQSSLKVTGSGEVVVQIGSTDAGGTKLVLDGDSDGDGSGNDFAYLKHNANGHLEIAADNPGNDAKIHLKTGNANNRVTIDENGHMIPYANNTYDLGSTSNRWRDIYTNDLHLSNVGHTNDVDGTWGDWTIQEGESDLFLKNNRSGKKYKFNLTEVS